MQTITKPEPEREPDKYRYVCQGCTNDAIRSTSLMQGIKITCPTCGKEQITHPDNWIVL